MEVTAIEKINRTRPYAYTFRATEQEKNLIDKKLKESGLSMTDFIIRTITGKSVKVIENAPELLTELKRQGNNLNQSVRNYYFDTGTKEQILSCADKLKEVYRTILSAVGKT